jgi:ribosomal protein L37AE/L43A
MKQNYTECSIEELHRSQLYKITDDTKMLEYIVKTGDILIEYFNNKNAKDNLKHQYLMLTDFDYRIKHSRHNAYIYCNECNSPRLNIESGCFVCTECGKTENMISYTPDEYQFKKYIPYHKVTHLKKRLKEFQNREPNKVPDNIITIIINEMNIRNISTENCTIEEIHRILKFKKLPEYYNNIHQIHCDITNKQAMYIPQQIEEIIIEMFKRIKPIFKILCPNRRNFLNYSYLLNKIFQILDKPDIAKCFPLLKIENNLLKHDEIFKQICDKLNWKFYPSSN